MPLVGKTMAEGHTHRMAVLCEKLGSTLREILDGTCPQPAKPEKAPKRPALEKYRETYLIPLKSRDLKPCSSVRKLVVPWTWSSWDWAAGEWAYPGCWRIWQDGILKPTGKTSNAGGNFRVPVTVRPCEWLPVVYQPERMTVENIGTPPADILSLSPSGPGMETVIWNHWY